MSKIQFPPGNMLNPVPAVMVSCGSMENPNIITIAWTGTVCSDPPMTYISIRPARYSYDIIRETGEFTINLVNQDLTFAADFCGVRSGRDLDKFREQNLTAVPGEMVGCPSIKESPVSIECKVRDIIQPAAFCSGQEDEAGGETAGNTVRGSHDMFLAEIVNVLVDERLLDEAGTLRMDRADLISYNHGHYYALHRQELGRFGYSVMKPSTRRRYEKQKRAASRARHRRK